jgi:NADPH:quinone reductase-like Zn-dependent oxidoreductase
VLAARQAPDPVAGPGQAVVRTGRPRGSGGYAEQAAVAEAELIPLPDGLGLPAAAAGPRSFVSSGCYDDQY